MIFDNCDIGRRARVRRAILDKNVRVPEDADIGYDLERDRETLLRHRERHRGHRGNAFVSGRARRCWCEDWLGRRRLLGLIRGTETDERCNEAERKRRLL